MTGQNGGRDVAPATFAGVACVGRAWLFDSHDMADHATAAALCASCPALELCHALLIQRQAEVGIAMQQAGGGPSGTWAGQLVGKRDRPRAECGTPSGWVRHVRRREESCEPCREAHRVDESQRYSRRRLQEAS